MMEDKQLGLPKKWIWTKVGSIAAVTKLAGFEFTKYFNYQDLGPVRVVRGLNVGHGKFKADNFKYIDASISNALPRSQLHGGELLIAYVGTLGTAAILPKDGNRYHLGPNVGKVVIDKEIGDARFLLFYLLSSVGQHLITSTSKAVAQSSLSMREIRLMDIPLAPLPEQHRVVAKIEELFTKLDAGVEALKQMKAQLKRYRQAVLKYAFEGKLTQEWREANKGKIEPASVLSERIKEERKKDAKGKNKELPLIDTSELSELPKGWVRIRLGEISEINPRIDKEGVPDDTEVTFLPMRCVEELTGHINLSLTKKLSEVIKGYTSFIEGDLLFAKITPCMENGKVAIAYGLKNGIGFGSTEFHIIRLFESLPKKFLFFFLIQEGFRKDAQRSMTGSAGQLRVPVNYMNQVAIPLPPLPEQQKIVEEIESRLSIAENLERVAEESQRQSDRLRQSILKKAFEGKLVAQDPTDESAEKLLGRIKEEKAEREAQNNKTKKHRGKNPKQMELI